MCEQNIYKKQSKTKQKIYSSIFFIFLDYSISDCLTIELTVIDLIT